MSAPKTFKIEVSERTLKKLIKINDPKCQSILMPILIFKNNENVAISKRFVALKLKMMLNFYTFLKLRFDKNVC